MGVKYRKANIKMECLCIRTCFIEDISELPEDSSAAHRMTPKWKKAVGHKMSEVRKKIVKAQKASSTKVALKYRAVEKHSYEAKHPGRIAAQGLKVEWVDTPSGIKECVMLRKTPKDSYDVEVAEKSGVIQEEEHEDGHAILRKGQADKKFAALAASSSRALAAKHEKSRTVDSDAEPDDDGSPLGSDESGAPEDERTLKLIQKAQKAEPNNSLLTC